MLALAAACTTTRTTETGKEVCLIWQDQSYSASKDSQQTVEEIRAKNAKRAAYCKGTKP